MIFLWNGRGYLGLAAVLPALASCAGLDFTRGYAPFAGGASLALGGYACWHFGRICNRRRAQHTMDFVPLSFWGVVYLAFGAFFGLAGLSMLVRGVR